MGDLVDDLARERMLVLEPARLDRAEHSDGAQEMLVDRVMMIHRELHHPDDAPEIGNEAAEHAGLVHPPQRRLGRAPRSQDFEEEAIGLRVLAQGGVDALQRLGDEPGRVGVNGQVRAVGDPEQADQIHRIALERVAADDVDPVVLDLEVRSVRDGARAAPQAPDEPVEHRGRLRLTFLERGADDRRQVAHVLRHQEVMLHETLDVGLSGARRIAELPGDRPLDVEAQSLLGVAGEKMQPAPHRPQEFLAPPEKREFPGREQADRDQLVRVADAIDVFRDPEQGIEIAQAPLALFDVGLDEIARRARLPHPLLALRQLGGDEFRRRLGDDLPVEPRLKRLEQPLVAGDEPRLDQRGADRHVAARLFQALVDRAGRMADLQLEVPQHVKQRLDDLLDRRGRLVGQKEQKIDVGRRREQAASVSAHRDDCRQGRSHRGRRQPARSGVERNPQEVVHLGAQGFGAGSPGPARLQRLSRLVAARRERRLQRGDRRVAKADGVVAMAFVELRELVDELRPVEPLAGGRGARGAGAAFDRGGVGHRHCRYIPLPPRACKAPMLSRFSYALARLASIASQIATARSGPPRRLIARMPVGEVTLISVR